MDDDILLEVVMFVGVLCNEGTAPLLVQSGLVSGTLHVFTHQSPMASCRLLHLSYRFMPHCHELIPGRIPESERCKQKGNKSDSLVRMPCKPTIINNP